RRAARVGGAAGGDRLGQRPVRGGGRGVAAGGGPRGGGGGGPAVGRGGGGRTRGQWGGGGVGGGGGRAGGGVRGPGGRRGAGLAGQRLEEVARRFADDLDQRAWYETVMGPAREAFARMEQSWRAHLDDDDRELLAELGADGGELSGVSLRVLQAAHRARLE